MSMVKRSDASGHHGVMRRGGLRRAASALGLAVALSGALMTSQANASLLQSKTVTVKGATPPALLCIYEDKSYSEGSIVKMGDVTKTCRSGEWT
jgi:hypothetical protein